MSIITVHWVLFQAYSNSTPSSNTGMNTPFIKATIHIQYNTTRHAGIHFITVLVIFKTYAFVFSSILSLHVAFRTMSNVRSLTDPLATLTVISDPDIHCLPFMYDVALNELVTDIAPLLTRPLESAYMTNILLFVLIGMRMFISSIVMLSVPLDGPPLLPLYNTMMKGVFTQFSEALMRPCSDMVASLPLATVTPYPPV